MSFSRNYAAKKIILLLILLNLQTLVWSQSKFTQKLEWKSDPNVYEYKIEIQDKTGKIISSEVTQKSSIELSLNPGSYKYKISAYDLLGRESVSTNWISIEILKAKQPTIVHNQNLESLDEDGSSVEIELDIADVSAGTKAELVNVSTGAVISGTLILSKSNNTEGSLPVESEIQNATAAHFKKVTEGQWKIVITNPSGLTSESDVFEIKNLARERKLAAEKAEKERIEQEKIEAEKLAKEKAEFEKKEAERIAKEKAEAERLEKERLEAEKLEAERKERERIALEKAEAERLEREKKQKEELAKFQAEIERIQKERLEKEKKIREERITQELEVQHKLEEARVEAERLVKEREEEERHALELAQETEKEEPEIEEEEKKKKKKPRRDWDRKFYLAGGAGFAIPVMDEEIFTKYFSSSMNYSLNAKLDFTPLHNAKNRFGFGFEGKYINYDEINEYYDIMLTTYIVQANLVYYRRFGTSKNYFMLKAGGGLVLIQNNLDFGDYTYSSRNSNKEMIYAYPQAGAGLALQFTMGHSFTAELGADVNALFVKDNFALFCTPQINLGFKF